MRIPVRAKIKKIEQSNTVSVFGTLNANLGDIVLASAKKFLGKDTPRGLEKANAYDLIVRLRKPSSEHPFSFLYEQLVKRFGEIRDKKFVIKEDVAKSLDRVTSPYSAATFILNEFFEACNDLTQEGEYPFECIEQKRDIADKLEIKQIKENKLKKIYEEGSNNIEEKEEIEGEYNLDTGFISKEEVEAENKRQQAIEDEVMNDINGMIEDSKSNKKPKENNIATTIPTSGIPGFDGSSYIREMNAIENSLYPSL